jgi:hypothetical protein
MSLDKNYFCASFAAAGAPAAKSRSDGAKDRRVWRSFKGMKTQELRTKPVMSQRISELASEERFLREFHEFGRWSVVSCAAVCRAAATRGQPASTRINPAKPASTHMRFFCDAGKRKF